MNRESDNNLEEWEARLAEYTLGVMEEGAASAFELQLNECKAHVSLAQQYTQVISTLAYVARPADPPMGHKARFMSRMAATPQQAVGDGATQEVSIPASAIVPATPALITKKRLEPYSPGVIDMGEYRERRRIRLSLPAIAAIAAVLVVLVGGTAFVTSQMIPPKQVWPQFVAFPFQGQGPQPSASAYCVINTKTKEVQLLTSDLRPLSSQQVYELWWLKSTGDPIAAGTFRVDDTGKAQHTAKLPDVLSGLMGAEVTVELAPGVSKPAGERVLFGEYVIP